MNDQAEGTIADAGQAVQKRLNQAGDVQAELVQFIRDNPISAVLLGVGLGYLLGKII
jgi:F0F1-type ATP synthase assembly protein I